MCMMALGLIGGLVSAVGSIAAGQAQANSARAQAAVYDRQAAAERLQADYNAKIQRDRSIRLMSQQRAGFLSAGLALQGSPLDVIADTTRETELDVSAIRFNGEIKAQNFETQAAAYRVKADSAEQAGFIGALSPIIRGFGGGSNFSFATGTSLED